MSTIIPSAIINALAFTGSSFFFGLLNNKSDSKRHNLALEQLESDRDDWNEERISRIDYINKRLTEQAHAEIVFHNADDALKEYYYNTGKKLTLLNGKPFPELRPEPVLEDYLDEDLIAGRQTAELVFIGTGIVGVGGLIYYWG